MVNGWRYGLPHESTPRTDAELPVVMGKEKIPLLLFKDKINTIMLNSEKLIIGQY